MPYLKKEVKKKPINYNREKRQKIYQSVRWKKLRQVKLMANPLCEICLQRNKIVPAVDVHHINSFINYSGKQMKYMAYDFNNLLSLCKECHSWLHRNGTTHNIDIQNEIKQMEEYEKKNKRI